jgi:hypothetical protein
MIHDTVVNLMGLLVWDGDSSKGLRIPNLNVRLSPQPTYMVA